MQIIIHYKNLKIICQLASIEGLSTYAYHDSIAQFDYLEPLNIDETNNYWHPPQGPEYWQHARLKNPTVLTEHLIFAEFIAQLQRDLPENFAFYQQEESYILLGRDRDDNALSWVGSDLKAQYQYQFLITLRNMIIHQACDFVKVQDEQKEMDEEDQSQGYCRSQQSAIVSLKQLDNEIQALQPASDDDGSSSLEAKIADPDNHQQLKTTLLAMVESYGASDDYHTVIEEFKGGVVCAFADQGSLASTIYQRIALTINNAYQGAEEIECSHWRLNFQKVKLTAALQQQFCQIFMGNLAIPNKKGTPAELCVAVAQYYQQCCDELHEQKVQTPGIKESLKDYCRHRLNRQFYISQYLSQLWQRRSQELIGSKQKRVYPSSFPEDYLQQTEDLRHSQQDSLVLPEQAVQAKHTGFQPVGLSDDLKKDRDFESSQVDAGCQYAAKVLRQQRFHQLVATIKYECQTNRVAAKGRLDEIVSLVTNEMGQDEREQLIESIVALIIDIQQLESDHEQSPHYTHEEKNSDTFSRELGKIKSIFTDDYLKLIELCKKVNKPGFNHYQQDKVEVLSFLDRVTQGLYPDINIVLAFWKHIRDCGDIEEALKQAREHLEKIDKLGAIYTNLIFAKRDQQMGDVDHYEMAKDKLGTALFLLAKVQKSAENQADQNSRIIQIWVPITLEILHQLCKQWLPACHGNMAQRKFIDEIYDKTARYITHHWPQYLIGFSIQAGDNYLPYDLCRAATHYKQGLAQFTEYAPTDVPHQERVKKLSQTLQQRLEQAVVPIQTCISKLQDYLDEKSGSSGIPVVSFKI